MPPKSTSQMVLNTSTTAVFPITSPVLRSLWMDSSQYSNSHDPIYKGLILPGHNAANFAVEPYLQLDQYPDNLQPYHALVDYFTGVLPAGDATQVTLLHPLPLGAWHEVLVVRSIPSSDSPTQHLRGITGGCATHHRRIEPGRDILTTTSGQPLPAISAPLRECADKTYARVLICPTQKRAYRPLGPKITTERSDHKLTRNILRATLSPKRLMYPPEQQGLRAPISSTLSSVEKKGSVFPTPQKGTGQVLKAGTTGSFSKRIDFRS